LLSPVIGQVRVLSLKDFSQGELNISLSIIERYHFSEVGDKTIFYRFKITRLDDIFQKCATEIVSQMTLRIALTIDDTEEHFNTELSPIHDIHQR
jgi:hypothetical protein